MSEALEALRVSGGLEIAYSEARVPAHLTVVREPRSSAPEEILLELLAPYGLSIRFGAQGRRLVVPAAEGSGRLRGRVVGRASGEPVVGAEIAVGNHRAVRSDADGRFDMLDLSAGSYSLVVDSAGMMKLEYPHLQITAGRVVEVILELTSATMAAEITVHGDHPHPPAASEMALRELRLSPFAQQDALRAALQITAIDRGRGGLSVRGGRADELMLVIDGQEIIEPYHLRDFGSLLGIVPESSIARSEVYLGQVPVQWGERMGGVLSLLTDRPGDVLVDAALTISEDSAQVRGSGKAAAVHWLAAYRYGQPEIAQELGELDAEPTYWDGFAKLRYQPREGHLIAIQGLQAKDRFFFTRLSTDGGLVANDQFITDHQATHLWGNHSWRLSERAQLESTLFSSSIDRSRFGVERDLEDAGPQYEISDDRSLERQGLRSVLRYGLDDQRELLIGGELRRDEAVYSYLNLLDPFADGSSFRGTFHGEHYGLFGSSTWRPTSSWTLELGLRVDRENVTGEVEASPRLSASFEHASNATSFFGWGRFHQFQRPNELRVPDGERRFQGAERAAQWTLAHRREVGRVALEVELYHRDIGNPRSRFENLFKPISRFPEIELDRIQVMPQRSRASGLEISLQAQSRSGRGRLSYSLGRIEDWLATEWLPRRTDRRHRLRAEWTQELSDNWRLHTAWHGASGRAYTPPAALASVAPESDAAIGPRSRLSAQQQLDLRFSTTRTWRRWQIHLEAGVDNLFDNRAIRGFEVDLSMPVEEGGLITGQATPELDRGLTPRFTISIDF